MHDYSIYLHSATHRAVNIVIALYAAYTISAANKRFKKSHIMKPITDPKNNHYPALDSTTSKFRYDF